MIKTNPSMENEKQTLVELEEEILAWGGEEVTPMTVYSDIFDLGTGLIQKRGEAPLTSQHRSEMRSQADYKTNPIGRYKYPYITKDGEKKTYMRERVLFEDTFAEVLSELQEKDFAILGGLSYFGRSNKVKNANKMHAMIFDLDGQTPVTMRNFFQAAFSGGAYPIPNYIALSGHGAHLYYVFEYPIPLYPDLKDRLNTYKDKLTKGIWNAFTSEEEIQSQGINQGFRVIGGKTKIDGYRVKAFKMNDTPFNLEMLNEFAEEFAIDERKLWESWSQEEKQKKLTFKDAIKTYPGWYEEFVKPYEEEQAIREKKGLDRQKRRKVVVKGWRVKGDNLYNWWLKKTKEGAKFGNRHNCMMVLAAIAKKSDPKDVPYERLLKDAYDLLPFLNSLSSEEPFTKDDLEHALKTYDDNYLVLSVNGINKLTKMNIQKTKRNNVKQAWHLEDIRTKKQNMKKRGQSFQNPEGRPQGSGTKESIVIEFIKNNPGMSVTEIARELGVSRPTVYKYKKLV